MENEIMNTELEVANIESDDVMFGVEEEAAKAPIGAIIAIGAIVVVAGIAIAKKCKGKMTEMQIKSLEKKGYIVTKAESCETTDACCEEAEEIDE